MGHIAIQVENLSKRYRIGTQEKKHDTLTAAAVSWLKSPLNNFRRLRSLTAFSANGSETDVLYALKDISFTVNQGEVIGVIGHNGAGKSTLLKIMSRITPPSSGRVLLNGRVASLLEVGTGFHPELTGRENVYLNGTILGMHKAEVDRKFDEIVEFAGVDKFIDTPVKWYSSGMRVRLAFSVAAHLEPEILLVDEVLSVGDAAFQKKSLGKMESVSRAGRTVLIVSHNMAAIEALSQSILWLSQGKIVQYTQDIEGCIRSYLNQNEEPTASGEKRVSETGIVRQVRCTTMDGIPVENVRVGEAITFHAALHLEEPLYSPRLRFVIFNSKGTKVSTLDTRLQMAEPPERIGPGEYTFSCCIPDLALVTDKYYVSVILYSRKEIIWEENYLFSLDVHPSDYYGTGRYPKMTHGVTALKAEWQVQVETPLPI